MAKLTYGVRGGLFLKKKNIPFMDNLQVIGNLYPFIDCRYRFK